MDDLIRLQQGEVVARSRCTGCGGPVQWKATRRGEKVAMICSNGLRDAARWGQPCGNRSFAGLHDSQALIARYVAGGSVPLALDDKTPKHPVKSKAKTNDKDQDTGSGSDDTGHDDDTGSGSGGAFSGIFGGIFGD